ncbi:phosphatidylglycerol:prolipoprotein diacylglycerol transferase [Chitinivorax tropicus]|uniref:Phosphatidylglycerol--prolipoprotein diacylglyceryl transferase n=1 Tax=Chitinivorax tropicus TaxID=714531 RepID=A0A840MPU6_9PROT|nr:prolipoprotein diacylglyceryl transferase [Chitinivorax tropicus]MBB5017271.1 phosphatidylglycerol:prolipoprotein diacylglycerol transferase [Chitinivorax tropicus]
MMIHPQFNAVAISLGPIAIRWYGLMYLIGFMLFIALGRHRIKRRPDLGWDNRQLDDLLFYGVLGVVLGGRLGYVLFYKLGDYLANPIAIFKIWEGGMSFHGGFLGVLVALWLFGRKSQKTFWQVADFVAPLVPTGLLAGRIGNFINGELWGRVTTPDAPWAMRFPQAAQEDITMAATHPQWQVWLEQYGGLPRHPSQLYQAALEGLCLFLILWAFSAKPRPTAQVSAVFLVGYGGFRFIAEFAREPDSFLGLLAGQLSMGQWLSLPMILIGIGLYIWAGKRAAR